MVQNVKKTKLDILGVEHCSRTILIYEYDRTNQACVLNVYHEQRLIATTWCNTRSSLYWAGHGRLVKHASS